MGRPKKEVSEEKIEQFQRELEQAGDRTDILLRDKKGRSRSCLLCRRRKQRCDHKVPSCTACLKAGVKCVQPVRYVNAANNNTSNHRNRTQLAAAASASAGATPNSADSVATATTIGAYDSPVAAAIASVGKVDKPGRNGSAPSMSLAGPRSDTLASDTSVPSSTASPDPNAKDDYTKLLERKLKYLERLISMNPTTATFNKKLTQYKKITHLMEQGQGVNGPGAGADSIPDLQITLPTPYSDPMQAATRPQGPGTHSPNGVHAQTASSVAASAAPFIKVSTSFFQRQGGSFPGSALGQETSAASPQQGQKQESGVPSSLIQHHNNTNNNSIPLLSSDSVDSIDFSKCIFAKYNLKEFYSYDPAFEFDEELSRSFLDTFFTRLQFKYPLLDEHEIYEFHENYIKNRIYSYSDNEFHFACGRMWLVYTISACLHMTTGKYKGQPPVRYFSTAIRHITRCGEQLNYGQRIELLTLLVLYLLRTDRDTMILYEIISDVMNICTKKLHLNKWDPNDPMANKKLRLFWCVYLLERMICVSVGQPYTVAEADIDLPYFSEDSFNTKNTKIHRGVHFINQSLKLRRTESKFVEKLNILPKGGRVATLDNKHLRKQLSLVNDIFHDLEVWRSNCVETYVKNFENETLKLYYYRSVRLLIQPYLEVLTPEDRLFRECQAAAGQICQLYKIFHQRTITGHSTPAVHTIFVAGVTLIYCMWLARNYDDERRKKLGDVSKHTRPLVTASLFSTMDDLRACSVCLYVMTERSDFARIFRDTFDQLMNATVGNLIERCGPNSSELIYMSSTGKDRASGGKSGSVQGEGSHNPQGISDNSKDNGMPPAVNRTFGKDQANEHVGFVENSQVDPDEQQKIKQRRGMLEKTSVPKSLSHLLTQTRPNTPTTSAPFKQPQSQPQAQVPVQQSRAESSQSSESTTSSSYAVVLNSTEDEDKMMRATSVHGHTKGDKQYIVKKPINMVEFNWKTFEHQAFVQQHFAQQNLQAYLTSVNHFSGAQQPIPPTEQFAGTYPLGETSALTANGNMYPPQSAASRLSALGPTSISTEPPSSPFNSDGALGVLSRAAAASTETAAAAFVAHGKNTSNTSAAAAAATPGAVPVQAAAPPLGVLGSFGLPTDKNPSDILFNNGTHNMINNISTWTTNSVNEMGQQEGAVIPAGAGAGTAAAAGAPGPGMADPTQTQATSVNGLAVPPPGMFGPSVSANGAVYSFASGATGGVDTPGSVHQHPAEEFWTMNDDYGFLT